MSQKWDQLNSVKVHPELATQLHHLKSKSRVRVSFNELANMSIREGISEVEKLITNHYTNENHKALNSIIDSVNSLSGVRYERTAGTRGKDRSNRKGKKSGGDVQNVGG